MAGIEDTAVMVDVIRLRLFVGLGEVAERVSSGGFASKLG